MNDKYDLANISVQENGEFGNFNKFKDQISVFNAGNEENYTNVFYSPNNDTYGIIEVSKDKEYIFIELDKKPYTPTFTDKDRK